jgi:pyruvate dehydrogenase E1 component beta subunit
VAARISAELFSELKAPVRRVTTRFRPIPSAKHLEADLCPTADKFAAAARSLAAFVR